MKEVFQWGLRALLYTPSGCGDFYVPVLSPVWARLEYALFVAREFSCNIILKLDRLMTIIREDHADFSIIVIEL
ncbi:MAG: hypothetical protein DWQ10_12300 [Calditrichaeota bacterium]|nr:MAG: hypothetical protein DWQ10_12300 [Calditrichota bacterium]